MKSSISMKYTRPEEAKLKQRLSEPVRFINILAGPRQVGKTTIVRDLIPAVSPQDFYISAIVTFVVLKGARPEGEAAKKSLPNCANGSPKKSAIAKPDEIRFGDNFSRRAPAISCGGYIARVGQGGGDYPRCFDAGKSGDFEAVEAGGGLRPTVISLFELI